MTRAKRKIDHLNYALQTMETKESSFKDITFVHNSLPLIDSDSVHMNNKIGELLFSSPIFINAMTGGGGEKTRELNEQFAWIAKETDLAVATGSQMAALKDSSERYTYEVFRKKNKAGIVFGNLGMDATVEQAKRAVEMIEANALQIHLNVVQELTMPEGDRDFSNVLKNIEEITAALEVPVIVKEVGFGMSSDVVRKLIETGIAAIDVGGYGGTNFAKIENKRREAPLDFFNDWGISTPAAIIEAVCVAKSLPVFASGGVNNALDIAKSIALGADKVGMAGIILKELKKGNPTRVVEKIRTIHEELKMIMVALGVENLRQLQTVPLVISGETHHWLTERGIDTKAYSKRKVNVLIS